MNSYYYNMPEGAVVGPIFAVAAVWLVVMLLCCGFAIVAYVFRSLSLYTIARRRGISNPWLSWLPVGCDWILGSISDQYKYLTQGKNQARRKVLMVLALITGICVAAVIALYVYLLVQIILMSQQYFTESQVTGAVMGPMLGMIPAALLSTVVGVVTFVFQQMCKYDLYKSCDPNNGVLFLVLGILFNVTEPFFLFACRNKELGMPPRKPEGVNPILTASVEPWENPAEE